MEFEIVRTPRKTVAISVKEGKVILRAPLLLTDKQGKKIIEAHREWIQKKLKQSYERLANKPSFSESDIKALRKNARTYFIAETEKFSKIMNLKYGRITITGAKTRFGSCSSKGNISFSYWLMLYPERAREYVIVHELAHLLEMNHSKRFYSIVLEYLPDYKERRKLLKNRENS